MNQPIYACALSSKDGEIPAVLELAVGPDEGLKKLKKIAVKHIETVMEGQSDINEFIIEIQNANDFESALEAFNHSMSVAYNRLDTAYSAEIVYEKL